MKKRESHTVACRAVAMATIVMFTLSGVAIGQAPAPTASPPAAGAPAQPAQAEKTFSQEQLDQLVAPIALYPDDLLAQVLMASTYPIEIVQAERWVKANPSLKDKALEDALQKQSWDPAVKSLAVFPQVLTMMSEKLDWTQQLGDAFLAQKEDVMKTAQALRAKAASEGNLKDSKEQKVITEKTETTTIIKIEPTNPEVVYVPTYNPTVVYGAWPYPAYPPYYYYPPGYVAGGALLGFTAGVIVGGALWGGCNWGRGDVNVNVNRYNNFNKTNISNGNWNHNVDHRGAVPYKDKGVAQKYNRGSSPTAANRDAYRGRGEGAGQSARSDFARSGGAGAENRAGGGAGGFDRGGAQGASNRDFSGTRNGSAFDTGGSRAQTQSVSNRGSSSMASSRASSGGARASPSAGGARAGGGAPRGGGGGGRGGGGRR